MARRLRRSEQKDGLMVPQEDLPREDTMQPVNLVLPSEEIVEVMPDERYESR